MESIQRGALEVGRYSTVELRRNFATFFAELKTCKGEDYEPDSLRMMLGALNHHLRDSGCAHGINDEQFLGAIFRWPQQSEVKVPPRKRAHIIDSDSDQDM